MCQSYEVSVKELLDHNLSKMSTKLHFYRMAVHALGASTHVSSASNISTNSFRFNTLGDQ